MRQQAKRLLNTLKQLAHYLSTGPRRKIITALLVVLSLFVISQIIIQNWETLQIYLWQARPLWLLYAILLFIIDLFIALFAWHQLVSDLANYSNLRNNFLFSLRANLARRIPGSIWVIASRAILYQEVGISKTTTTLLSGLELAFFIISGIITALLTLPFWTITHSSVSPTVQLGLLLISIPLSLLLVHPSILQYVWKTISKTTPERALQWQDTMRLLILYIASWVVGGGVLFVAINIFYPYDISHLMITIGIWSLAGTISLTGFITISFIGLREVSLGLLLTPLIPTPVILIVAIFIRLLWLTGELTSSLIALKL